MLLHIMSLQLHYAHFETWSCSGFAVGKDFITKAAVFNQFVVEHSTLNDVIRERIQTVVH